MAVAVATLLRHRPSPGLYDDVGSSTGNIASGGQTDDTMPTAQGWGHAGDVVKVYDGGTLLGSTTVASNGSWSFTPSSALPNGSHDLTATASANGHSTSPASGHYMFTIVSAPVAPPTAPTITGLWDDFGSLKETFCFAVGQY